MISGDSSLFLTLHRCRLLIICWFLMSFIPIYWFVWSHWNYVNCLFGLVPRGFPFHFVWWSGVSLAMKKTVKQVFKSAIAGPKPGFEKMRGNFYSFYSLWMTSLRFWCDKTSLTWCVFIWIKLDSVKSENMWSLLVLLIYSRGMMKPYKCFRSYIYF